VEEEKKTTWKLAAGEPPPPPPPKQEGPTDEEKKIAEIEYKLSKIKEAKDQAEQKKVELDEKKASARAEKAEEKKAREEEKKRLAEEKKAALEAKRADQEEKRKADEEKRKADAEAKKADDEKKAAAKAEPSCPKGMALIPAGKFYFGSSAGDPMKGFGEKNNELVELQAYCIDYYEYPNKNGSLPRTDISYSGAEGACKKAKKRLCSEEEWEKACKGPGGLRYPYGNKWDPASCNSEDDQGNKKQVGPAGALAKCRSGYGIADLSGNVSEWVGGGSIHKGGSADKPNYAVRCAAKAKSDPGKTSGTLGFRCCADAN
jgi:formylglycine-generating enzyme required for sulfatase activity